MKEVILALLAGFIVGFLFAAIKLPIPAPPALAGVAGIVGVYLGFRFFLWVGPMISSVIR
ncbi:XapX domain-containing protein [Halobacillus sp. Marseille-Q1614]|uniref:XapX domain-containing protein n=1 Tax=Halobacillus sp. Marseille-Q1614 TaxID=2709134 RepID=UPI00156F6DC4|nr:XapX domain-containing protein [Halobacillus sp. Marseille-Q1614]